MEVILLWKKPKTFFGLLIFPNIITEKWGYKMIPKAISLALGLKASFVCILGTYIRFCRLFPDC